MGSELSWRRGRRVSKAYASPAPNATELARACAHLGVTHTLESTKAYCRDASRRKGRVRVSLFDAYHQPVQESLPNRMALYKAVGTVVKQLNPNRDQEVAQSRHNYRQWLERMCVATRQSASDTGTGMALPQQAAQLQPQQQHQQQSHALPQLPQQHPQQQNRASASAGRHGGGSTAGVKGGKKGKGKKR